MQPKNNNLRKQDLKEKKIQRKQLNNFILRSFLKIILFGGLIYGSIKIYNNVDFSKYFFSPKKDLTATTNKSTKNKEYKLDYNFYNLLPKEKIADPDVFKNNTSPSNPIIIQVASLRKKSDIPYLIWLLNKMGYTNIKTDSIRNRGKTWYRVNLGPFRTFALAKKTQKKLEQNKIRSSIIKVIYK